MTSVMVELQAVAAREANAMCIGPFGSDLLASDLRDNGVPVVFVRNVRPGRFDPTGLRYVSPDKAAKLRSHMVKPGDIVITKMGLPPGIAAAYPKDAPAGIVTADIIKLTPDSTKVATGYLVHFLNSVAARVQVESFTFGVTRPKVTLAAFRGLRISLPSLAEQGRVAELLDKADAIRRKRKEAIAFTEEVLRSAFLEMFGDPVTNPRRWDVRPLGDLVSEFEAGWSANGEPRPRTGKELGVLKISAVTSGFFRPEENKAVHADAVARPLVTPRKGDLLFSRANTRELVGATCLIEEDHPELFLPDKLWNLRPSRFATTAYLKFLLSDEGQRRELTSAATGTSGSMQNISMEKARRALVPAAPIELQERFASLVWATLAIRGKYLATSRASEGLFATLQRDLFRTHPQHDTEVPLTC